MRAVGDAREEFWIGFIDGVCVYLVEAVTGETLTGGGQN